jgi:hypothetical protein
MAVFSSPLALSGAPHFPAGRRSTKKLDQVGCTFQIPPVSYLTGDDPYSAAVADLNGDGFPDLAVPNISSNDVTILINDGT